MITPTTEINYLDNGLEYFNEIDTNLNDILNSEFPQGLPSDLDSGDF